MPTTRRPRVSINIVSWNSLTHLPACLQSIVVQDFLDFSVLVVDNGSADGTVEWLHEHYPHIHLLRNTRNLGFCRGHNQAIRLSETDYVLILNQDVVLAPDWLARGVAWLDQHPQYGAWGGKMMRFTYDQEELKNIVVSDIIDSAGLQATRRRHFFDRGSGQRDKGQFDQAGDVFGISGACLLLRRAALETCRYKNEYFDEDFFAYKDDIDLTWRLQRLGWLIRYDGLAVAYHHRTIRGQSATADKLIALNYRSRSRFNSYYSYRNHWLLIFKNETSATVWSDLPWIAWYEFKKLLFLLVTRPSSLRGLIEALKLWPAMRAKALVLDHQAKRPAREIRRQWFRT